MRRATTQLLPGTLWPSVLDHTRHALACGALQPIETHPKVIDDAGIPFVVRRVSSLARKARARHADTPGRTSPFLPYEPELLVAEVSETHVALLNKFPVIPHHLLVVTRRFEPQDAVLNVEDFAALAACMAQLNGLAFYNAGTAAGASQAHKHLQIVPLPLGADGVDVPMEVQLQRAPAGAGRAPGLPFEHSFIRLDRALRGAHGDACEPLWQCYRDLLHASGIRCVAAEHGTVTSRAYNLLVSRRWMLLVPRERELFDSISVNALGFAGSLFVRSRKQLAIIERHRPLCVLRDVASASS